MVQTAILKISILGAPDVGKTAIINEISENRFHESYYTTTGVAFSTKSISVELDSNTTIPTTLQLWNINSIQRLEYVRSYFLKGSVGLVIFFDLTQPETLETAKKFLYESKDAVHGKLPFILIGNRADLLDEKTEVINRQAIKEFAEKEGGFYYELSEETTTIFNDAINKLAYLSLKFGVKHEYIQIDIDEFKPKTPLLTVDAVIVYEKDNIILIRRKNPPFQGELALPGGFVDIGETVENACIREAKEETNIDVKILKMIGVYSDPSRDPRHHTVSVGFLCEPITDKEQPKAQDDAAALEIVPISNITSRKLAFDHMKIVKDSGIL